MNRFFVILLALLLSGLSALAQNAPAEEDKDWPRFSYYEAQNEARKLAVAEGSAEKPLAVLFGDSITRN
jgi:hypothetical protein